VDAVIDLDEQRRERPSEVRIMLGGETFRARTTVRPEATLPWDDFYEGEDTSMRRQIEVADQVIMEFLISDDHDKWRALRAREEDPIGTADIIRFVRALQEAAADRPTEPSGDSSTGIASGEASSMDGSSSRVAIQSV
jgi:hypothetical protein